MSNGEAQRAHGGGGRMTNDEFRMTNGERQSKHAGGRRSVSGRQSVHIRDGDAPDGGWRESASGMATLRSGIARVRIRDGDAPDGGWRWSASGIATLQMGDGESPSPRDGFHGSLGDRGSVVECGGKPRRDTAVVCRRVCQGLPLPSFRARQRCRRGRPGAPPLCHPHSTTLPRSWAP